MSSRRRDHSRPLIYAMRMHRGIERSSMSSRRRDLQVSSGLE